MDKEKENNGIDWLLLTALENLGKEHDKLKTKFSAQGT